MTHRWTVGVAGHVDHGKTSLVNAITGIDTDRRPEEKTRGMTIEAGVAELALPSGRRAALIDVPGHTDYLKNAIRGLSGVDAAILVVAADDGVMPQTREHLDILSCFGAGSGVVVVSKADLVDAETLMIAELELQEMLEGTFLEEAPILTFSVHRPDGRQAVLQALDGVLPPRDPGLAKAPFRMWIDQLRSLPGIGTVVSGTVSSGRIQAGDAVEVMPGRVPARARSLESHGRGVDRAEAGQRVGVNLPRVPLSRLGRGMALAAPGSVRQNPFLNALVRVLPTASRPLENRQKVKLCVGSSVSVATVVLMTADVLAPGGSGLVQFRLRAPGAAKAGDPFVATLMNRPTVVAGGTVLEVPHAKFRPARAQGIVGYLEALRTGNVDAFVEQYFRYDAHRFLTAAELSRTTGIPELPLAAAITSRVRRGSFLYVKGRGAVARSQFEAVKSTILSLLRSKGEAETVRSSVALGEIAGAIPERVDDHLLQMAVEDLRADQKVVRCGGGYQLPDALGRISTRQAAFADLVARFAEGNGLSPFSADSLWKHMDRSIDKREVQRLLEFMCTRGQAARLGDGRFLAAETLDAVKARVKAAIDRKGAITLRDSTEILGYGRWGGAPVFEHLDRIGFTRRVGDERVLNARTSARTEPAPRAEDRPPHPL
jgi:selenocysteine-specific elongation factor